MQSDALANTPLVAGTEGLLFSTSLPEYLLLGMEARLWYERTRRRHFSALSRDLSPTPGNLSVRHSLSNAYASSSTLPTTENHVHSGSVSLNGSISQNFGDSTLADPTVRRPEDLTSVLASSQPTPNPVSSRRTPPPSPPPRPTCTICGDLIEGPIVRAPCGHELDVSCLCTMFDKATRDESLFPPKCCQVPIEVDDVREHLHTFLVHRFLRKACEFRTKHRVYCHNPRCSVFLGAATTASSCGTPHAFLCPECGAETCGSCKAAAHAGAACRDHLTDSVLALAKELGWQRCPECKHLVERTQGCNHMSCVCGKQFCYQCGTTWKGCSCRQFAADPVQGANQAGRGRRAGPTTRRTRNQAPGRAQRPTRGARAQQQPAGPARTLRAEVRTPSLPVRLGLGGERLPILFNGAALPLPGMQLGRPTVQATPIQIGPAIEVGMLPAFRMPVGEATIQEPMIPELIMRPPHVPRR